MNHKELKELIEFLVEKDIAEFELERGDVKVRVKRGSETAVVAPEAHVGPVPITSSTVVIPGNTNAASPVTTMPSAGKDKAEEGGFHVVKSPIVGTFYEAPSPG